MTRAVCVQRNVLYRIERDGKPVALALSLANGEWGLFDLNERRISVISFPNPKAVAAAAQRRGLGA